jgi:GDP-mannose 6-dehydrogenase
MESRMRVSVFGLGYVGSVTAAYLAGAGHEVVGVDVNGDKVALLNRAVPPVVEPGLAELLEDVVGAGRLRATTSAADAVRASDIALVCVGTPGKPNGQLSTTALARVAAEIGAALARDAKRYAVVVRSTVLPGTTEGVVVPALRRAAGRAVAGVRVAVNPEFMREGSSLRDFAAPPLTLVGSPEPETSGELRRLYASVEAPWVQTDVRTAEMVKYAANAFHALKVCFANEMGDICAALGADAREVMRIFALDTKLNVSAAYLQPGFAFGGSCLPKDLRAMLHAARAADLGLPLLSTILPSNEAQVRRGIDAVLATRRRRVGVIGLAFKPATDDLRESPLVTLVEQLIGKGLEVRVLDGSVAVARLTGANRQYIEEEIPHVASLLCDDVEGLLAHAEVLVIGNAGPEAARALALAGPHHLIVDLTRGAARARAPQAEGA